MTACASPTARTDVRCPWGVRPAFGVWQPVADANPEGLPIGRLRARSALVANGELPVGGLTVLLGEVVALRQTLPLEALLPSPVRGSAARDAGDDRSAQACG